MLDGEITQQARSEVNSYVKDAVKPAIAWRGLWLVDSGILDESAAIPSSVRPFPVRDWQGIAFRKNTKSENQKIEEKRTRSRLVFQHTILVPRAACCEVERTNTRAFLAVVHSSANIGATDLGDEQNNGLSSMLLLGAQTWFRRGAAPVEVSLDINMLGNQGSRESQSHPDDNLWAQC